MRKLQGEEGEKVEKQSATLFTEDETATDESEHGDIFIMQISPVDDDQFKSQIHAAMLRKAVERILSFTVHICPTQPRKLRKIAREMNKVMRKFSINQSPHRTEMFPKDKTDSILECVIIFQVTLLTYTELDYNFKLIIDQVKSNRLHLKK